LIKLISTQIFQKKYKDIRLNFSKSSSGLPPKVYDNSIVIEDDVDVDNLIIPYNNNNDISLEYINLFLKKLDVNTPLVDNIPKKEK
jgi:hypothetical protein